MSTHIMAACWPLQGMSSVQKAVLISLADNANDDGVCWPSVATISVRTCLSERAVRNAVRWLEEAGLLQSNQRSGRSTWYTITVDGYHPGTTCPPAPDADLPRHDVPTTPAPDADHPGTTCPQNRKGTVIEPPLEPEESPQAAPTPDSPERIPYEKIRELYNEILGSHLSRCMGVNDKHRKGIRACYNLRLEGAYPFRDHGLEFWRGLFTDVLDCPFLLGQNNRGWRADFGFLTNSSNLQKFMEGKYDNPAA